MTTLPLGSGLITMTTLIVSDPSYVRLHHRRVSVHDEIHGPSVELSLIPEAVHVSMFRFTFLVEHCATRQYLHVVCVV